jgi:hypothetical protein
MVGFPAAVSASTDVSLKEALAWFLLSPIDERGAVVVTGVTDG